MRLDAMGCCELAGMLGGCRSRNKLQVRANRQPGR